MSGAGDLSGFSLLDLFKAEAETHVATLETGLVALEADPTASAGLQELMRAAHSIKGAARIVGLEPVVKVAHAMEDCFVAAQKGQIRLTSVAVDALLAGTDLLRSLAVLSPASGAEALAARAPEIAAVVDRVRAAARGEPVQSEGATPPPPPVKRGQTQIADLPSAPAAAPAQPGDRSLTPSAEDGVVRVSSQGLSRMLAFAGETLVEAWRLAGHARSVEGLKRGAARLAAAVDRLAERADEGAAAEGVADALAAVRVGVDRVRALLGTHAETLEGSVRRAEDLAGRLYGEVLASRMRPFGEVLGGFPRLVRDLAKELGKRARLEVLGRDVLVDRDILDRIDAPLNHLVRNALDHGLEKVEERAKAGKPPEGNVRIEARHRGGMLEVEVKDDGRGVDPEALRRRIVERRLVAAEIAKDLSQAELLEFLFLPGFSTKERVTEISGRGVGLDVVHRMAQEVGGGVTAESTLGQGLRFTLVLPITRSVVRAALVEVAGEAYAFPLTRIERLVRLEEGDVQAAEGRQHYLHEGRPVGLVAAAEALGLTAGPRAEGSVHAVQLAAGGERYGLAVDRFLGEQDLVVRPLDPRLGKVPNLSAAAVLEDGNPVLVVDTDDLVRSVDLLLHQGRLRTIRVTARKLEGPRSRRRVLVVDDSRTVREVERGLLTSRGFAVDVAVDGSDGWNSVRAGGYDLVITDVDMPRMNGIELVRRIKQDPTLKKTPVMIVSYKDREEDRLRGLEAGADAYVTKSAFQETGWVDAVVDLVGEP